MAGSWEERRNKLDRVAIYDKFRVFYSLSGSDSVPDDRKIDANGNGTPDFIEEVGARLRNMDDFLRKEVALVSPLKSNRYIGKAHYIDVNILGFSGHKQGPKNGVAYDGTPKFSRSLIGQVSLNVLAIDLSGSVDLKTNSVEHELFHLYQNGYTFFKNRWYTEGTARWSELIILNRIGKRGALPDTVIARDELFKKTYTASTFWNELIFNLDNHAKGKIFIKHFLEELDYADNLAAKERGLSNISWKESEQRSKANDQYIWQAIKNVVRRMNTSSVKDEAIQSLINI